MDVVLEYLIIMNKIIGEKSIFAIEFKVNTTSPYKYGNILMWLSNKYIGFFEEEIMLDCSLGSFIELISDLRCRNIKDPQLYEKSDKEIFFYLLNDGGSKKDNSMFSIDESTDNFCIFVISNGIFFKFLWRIERNTDRKFYGYCGEIFSSEVQIDHAKKIIKDFDFYISNL